MKKKGNKQTENPRGMGCGGGGGVVMYTHGWFMSMYGENHHNIVK